jgi:hypothetical protein
MAITYTYTTLKTAIANYAADAGAKLDAEIDNTIIPTAETRVLRDMDLELFDATGNVTINSGSNVVTKPAGWIATRSLINVSGSTKTQLLRRSYEYLIDYAPDSSQTGVPIYYCELSDTQWMLAPTPTDSATGTSRYMKRPAGLSGSVSTTWLGSNAGDLLFKACMLEFLFWSKNTSTSGYGKSNLEAWNTDYQTLLAAAKMEFRHLIRNESMQGAK